MLSDLINIKKLRSAFEHANKKLNVQADQRAKRHNRGVNDHGLEIGAKVLQRNHVKGRNKIQSIWKPDKYEVVCKVSPSGNTKSNLFMVVLKRLSTG